MYHPPPTPKERPLTQLTDCYFRNYKFILKNMETHLVQVDISCLKMPTNKYYNRSAEEIYTCEIKKVGLKNIWFI